MCASARNHACLGRAPDLPFLCLTVMSRAASSPILKASLLLAVLVIGVARVRTADLPGCNQEITRCLSACRAVCARRITDNERTAKNRARLGQALSA